MAAAITSRADGSSGDRFTGVEKDHRSDDVEGSLTNSFGSESISSNALSDLNFVYRTDFWEGESKANINMASSFQFLPPTRGRYENTQHCNTTESCQEAVCSDSFSFDTTAPDNSLEDSDKSVFQSDSLIQQFDFVSMREKLEAQKEYLFDSLKNTPVLPKSLLKNSQSDFKAKKLSSRTLRGKLHQLGRSARHFVSNKIFKHQSSKQKCEIQLDGFDDRVERLIVVISQRMAANSREMVHVHLPSFFETHRILVPRFLLPSRPGEMMTVTVYGIAGQERAEELKEFREIVVSGVCTIQLESKPLVSARLALRPHWLGLSLAGHSKSIQTGGTHLKTANSHSDSYTFSTVPSPVGTNFTELCVLQKADPFREYLALSTSTCDQPAAFQASLSPGHYYSVCSYRLTVSSLREVFSVAASTPSAFFKAYLDKARVAEQMRQATEQADHSVTKRPVLCPSLLLLKPPGVNGEELMRMFSHANTDKSTTGNARSSLLEEGLYFCAWNAADVGDADAEGTSNTRPGYPYTCSWMAVQNPRLPAGRGDYIRIPSLSVFNLNTRLFFADSWSCYDKQFITLVLCAKGSPCHQVCKRHLQKLDPYNNPFLFRKRCYEPEPSVEVYASASVSVEVLYCNSESVQQLIASCSENVYFSKVCVHDKKSV